MQYCKVRITTIEIQSESEAHALVAGMLFCVECLLFIPILTLPRCFLGRRNVVVVF